MGRAQGASARGRLRDVLPAVLAMAAVECLVVVTGASILWQTAGVTVYTGDAVGQVAVVGICGLLIAVRRRFAGRDAEQVERRKALLTVLRTAGLAGLGAAVLASGSYSVGWVATWAATLVAALVVAGVVMQALRPAPTRWWTICADVCSAALLFTVGAEVHRWNVTFLVGGLVLVTGAALVGFTLRAVPRAPLSV